MASSTKATYTSAHRRYLAFCEVHHIAQPFPVTEKSLCKFAAGMNHQHRTMKTYLTGIQFAQIHRGLGDPFHARSMPLLEYTLSGIKYVSGAQPRQRLPITPEILTQLKGEWQKSPTNLARCRRQYVRVSLDSYSQGNLQFPPTNAMTRRSTSA